MKDELLGLIVFLAAFCFLVYQLREIWHSWISPQFKRDLEKLREQRRRRRAARRQ